MVIQGKTRRDKIEDAISVALLLAMFVVAPRSGTKPVDGMQTTLGGWQVPEWWLFPVGVALILFLPLRFLARKIWPKENVRLEWMPADGEPGNHPFDYQPWTFDEKTTAREYLVAREPSSIRSLMIGGDASIDEALRFWEIQSDWIEQAPEYELLQLIAQAEMVAGDYDNPYYRQGLVERVILAHRERGIPSRDEIDELIHRLEATHGELPKLDDWAYLRNEL